MTELHTTFDGLGRPTSTIQGAGPSTPGFTTKYEYDEEGNPTKIVAPGLGEAKSDYDARGLAYHQTRPDGAEILRRYDELGALRQYVDEEGRTTLYTTDGLGRIRKIEYPDSTNEETRYEPNTGAVDASRARDGRWKRYEYDPNSGRLLFEHDAGNADNPSTTSNPVVGYKYDDAGRLIRVATADAAVEYDDFDLLGRARTTRTIRYKKTGCLPSLIPCGTGLSTSPQIAEVHTQGHVWSAFDGERSRWRMPVTGPTLPTSETDTPWRNWIDEQHDAAGNLRQQQEAVDRLTPTVGPLLTQSVARGINRLAERHRGITTGASLQTRFGYADQPDAGAPLALPGAPPNVTNAPPSVPVLSVTPLPEPTGQLVQADTVLAGGVIAGSRITFNDKNRIETAVDLGLASRVSRWDYDGRARLQQSVMLRRAGSPQQPRVIHDVTDADLLIERSIDPLRLSVLDFNSLDPAGYRVGPLSWKVNPQTATPPGITAGNQLQSRTFTHGTSPFTPNTQTFTWIGGRRTNDGVWKLTFDVNDRLIAKENAAEGRRILFDYDASGRMVGRTAQMDASGTWTLETRTNVLAHDGLPAEVTFVWDPFTDQIVAMYDAGVVQAAATPTVETGLLRQYLHGDQAYDDPVEVLVASAAGETPRRYLPIINHAAGGSLEAVAGDNGMLIERVVYADAYGDAPKYLTGAIADHITTKKEASGTRKITIDFTETIDTTTIASGVRLTALAPDGSVLRVSSIAPSATDANTLEWSIDPASWTAFTAGAASVQVAVTSSLRFTAWGDRPLQAVSDWESLLNRATSDLDEGLRLVKVAPLADFDTTTTLYDVPDLYLVAQTESQTNLLFDFHRLPYRDPASGLIFARARWYDASTGSFLTPDPAGYADGSNLYAYAANDPINGIDPTGNLCEFANAADPLDWLKRCGEDMWSVAGEFVQYTFLDEGAAERNKEHAKGGANAMVKMAWNAVTGSYETVRDVKRVVVNGDGDAYDRLAQKTDAAAEFISDPLGSIVKSHEDAADRILEAEQAGRYEEAGGIAGEMGATDALMVVGAAEAVVAARNLFATIQAQGVRGALRALIGDVAEAEGGCTPCLAAGTPVSLPNGTSAIEQLHVGDRVASTYAASSVDDDVTAVDSVNWHVVRLEMPNPLQPGDVYEIETLRRVDWIVENEAFPGHTISMALTHETPFSNAVVLSVAPARIQPGRGRVVLSTFAHRAQLVSITLDGAAKPIESSPTHRFYSQTRQEWVAASTLAAGEQIRTREGVSTITVLSRHAGDARVYDIEVEHDHAYWAGDADVLSHNQCNVYQRSAGLEYSERINNTHYGSNAPARGRRTSRNMRYLDNEVVSGGQRIGVENKYFGGTQDGAVYRGVRKNTAIRRELAEVLKRARTQARKDVELLGRGEFDVIDWNLNASYPQFERWLKSLHQNLRVNVRP
ncbi:MAG TPA: RHS repeat-associated core domain-containing protein [Thermoanaerobaculia bacterium]|nr:RHS repeat-associated core domain-containing protein [Thermoanaerobaculia bacterium]